MEPRKEDLQFASGEVGNLIGHSNSLSGNF